MSAVIATVYYPHAMEAHKPGSLLSRSRWKLRRVKVLMDDGSTRKIYVTKDDYRAALIEGTADVDMGAVDDQNNRMVITYYTGRWHHHKWAPWGVGARMNPLVPGRTFAHGWRRGKQFGTRMELQAIPQGLKGLVSKVMYRGGAFGPYRGGEPPKNRVDLFIKRKVDFYGRIKVVFVPPWRGVSHWPIQGAQEALRKLGHRLPKSTLRGGKMDGRWGPETERALAAWAKSAADDGKLDRVPDYLRPWDEEIYWQIRDAARVASGG